ncbi:MAG: NAD-dependent epimerase/dehydratase family protein [Kiritimatiellae bacterium]|nr:NAD-dependent epimerase/dehydratase family protein [Kiritimatiellia bacterium]
MTYIVTGSTGLIGAALVKALAARGDHVVAAARNVEKAKRLFAGLKGIDVVEWDVTRPFDKSLQSRLSLPSPSGACLIHAAAETASRGFVERPVETIATIVDGTRNVLELARTARIGKVVFLSTMEVYGVPNVDLVTESDFGVLDPASVRSSYPEAKRLAENLCVAYAREHGVDVTIARLTQTFGPGVVRGDTRVFAQFAEAVLEKRDIVLHTEGRTARCYCYIDDAVSAILTLAEKGAPGEAYNVANPATFCTIREMAEMLAAAHPPTRVVVDLAGAAGRGYAPEFRMRLSTAKLEALGWKPRTGLLDAYDNLIASWREG